MQKMCAAPIIYHLPGYWDLETPQGVQGGTMGAGAIEIRCNYAPPHRQSHQEALKCIPAMPAAFLCFSLLFLQHEWHWGGLCPF